MPMEFDGVIHLSVDADRTRIPLPTPDDDDNRRVFTCCCDCGLTHVMTIGREYVSFLRASHEEAEKIRADALRQDPNLFPLRAGVGRGAVVPEEPRTFRSRAADALADACEVEVRAGRIDARSPIGDALLDYRDPFLPVGASPEGAEPERGGAAEAAPQGGSEGNGPTPQAGGMHGPSVEPLEQTAGHSEPGRHRAAAPPPSTEEPERE